ncbi:MAG: hypothetical protein K2P81_02200 [Bacteriovoracaceae bacterium]|nr:hypothetical protein [Bacteriovoracaceae bacterium]
MFKEKVFGLAREFSAQTHGSSDFDKDTIFVMGQSDDEFVPWNYIQKHAPDFSSINLLKAEGFVYSSYDFLELTNFDQWYQKQFQKKLTAKAMKTIGILHSPDQKAIFDTVEVVHKVHQILKEHKVLVNGKNLPVQLGEWYAKIIFGLHQIKSSSQRGFDFKTELGKTVEVKVDFHDTTSPKGVKIKKSLAELSDYIIVMYVAKNFTIRDILFLDSDFVLRKFDSKGHTIFLKDQDVQSYFFSRSDKHFDKVANKSALLRFSGPNLAMKLEDKL